MVGRLPQYALESSIANNFGGSFEHGPQRATILLQIVEEDGPGSLLLSRHSPTTHLALTRELTLLTRLLTQLTEVLFSLLPGTHALLGRLIRKLKHHFSLRIIR